MKIKHSQMGFYIKVSSLFIVMVVVGFLVFFVNIQNAVKENSQKSMITNVSRQSEHLREIVKIHYQYLSEIAEEMGEEEELLSERNLNDIVSLQKHTDLERVALIEPDGTSHYDNGDVKNVSHRRYFKEAMNGKVTLSEPLNSSVDGKIRVVFGVPVYKNEQVIGVLGGSCNVSAIGKMLFENLFGKEGNILILSSNGMVISCDDSSNKSIKIARESNLFEYYKKENLHDWAEKIEDDFESEKEGFAQFQVVKNEKTDYFLAYMPLGMNNWMIAYIVPANMAISNYSFVNQYAIAFLGYFTILVLLLILAIFRKSRKEKEQLMVRAQRDSLTGLYNKETTQNLISEIVSDGKMHGFMILDIDFFKSVNDTYGHAVGDKVLSAVGNLFQMQFRNQDIVGRIGGDEFIILMRDIQNNEIIEERINCLFEQVRNLSVPELGEARITLSAGVAISPKDGNTFMELYRHADKALYKVKSDGKNNYQRYKKM
nr:diguanylate cyclase [uncultured Blautia sp.]